MGATAALGVGGRREGSRDRAQHGGARRPEQGFRGEEDGGGARARGRRTGAGVTAEELGGGDGGGGAKFRQPFGVEFEGAKDLENLGEQRHIYSHGLTMAGNISRPPR